MNVILACAVGVALVVGASGCGTVCIVGVREAAQVQCEAGESWETCLPKVEREITRAQKAALELLEQAARAK